MNRRKANLMNMISRAVTVLIGSCSFAYAADPALPSVEWQARADNVPARIDELVKYGEAHGNDDAQLADAVGGLKETVAAKKSAPAWAKKTSWIEGSGANQVLFGVGVFSGATRNRALAFVVAENRARVEIAKLQNVTIVRKSEANGWRTITTATSARLANVFIVDWYAQGPTIYALASYAKPIAFAAEAPWVP
jgi:hypothetical protein